MNSKSRYQPRDLRHHYLAFGVTSLIPILWILCVVYLL